MPARVFVSYSHRDEAVATALAAHLKQLETLGLAELWLDRHLELGELWEARIFDEVRRSDVLVLLISPAFLASEFINEKELPLIAEVGRSGASVIPVVAAPCLWAQHPYLGSLQAFAQGRPLESPTTRTFDRQAAELVERLADLLRGTPGREGAPGEAERLEVVTESEAQSAGAGTTRSPRVDESGLAYKGSQLQTQIYVNARREDLEAAVRRSIPSLPADARLEWRSPLAAERFDEYRDGAFLQAVGLAHLAGDLRSFCPAGGPRWDGLAEVGLSDGAPGVVLVEGKSYPAEMEGGGAKAEGASRERIRSSLAQTQQALSLAPDPDVWIGRFYQFANRLAHLLWLRRMGVDAWLVHLLFTGDPHGPTSEAEWRGAVEQMHEELGLDQAQLDQVGVSVLPALGRSELTAPR